MSTVKVFMTGVKEYDDSILFHQWRASIHVEQIPERHHLNEYRVKGTIHVIRRDKRNAAHQYIALALNGHRILVETGFKDLFVCRFRLACVNGDELVV